VVIPPSPRGGTLVDRFYAAIGIESRETLFDGAFHASEELVS
jgi:hypothetical protein